MNRPGFLRHLFALNRGQSVGALSNPRYPEEFNIRAVNQVTEKQLPVADVAALLMSVNSIVHFFETRMFQSDSSLNNPLLRWAPG